MSESNRVSVKVVPEAVYGTTPTNSNDWVTQRFSGETLTATVNTVDSAEIRSDRMMSDMSIANKVVAGALNIELSPTTYDDFLEAAMGTDWTTDILNVGVLKKSFSAEVAFEDLSKYLLFKGLRVSQFTLDITFGSLVTGSVSFMGNGASQETSSALGTGLINAATTTGVMSATSDVGTVSIDGSLANEICIQNLTLDINNNLYENNCIGNEFAAGIGYGSSSVTGTVTMYLNADAWDLYGKVLTNSSVEMSYILDDGTNSYTFEMFNVKLSGDAPTSTAKDQEIQVTYNYTALLDATEGTSLRITRT